MKYSDIVEKLGNQGYFDLASIVQLAGEGRGSILIQLSRWCKSGKLLSLRRGMYAFPEVGPAVKINPALLANRLYSPSYISGYWALGFYGLIPEKVVTYTCVTQRVTREFKNPFGSFKYQHVKETAFFGYRMYEISGDKILMAEPEKALLDLWHLARGKWDHERMTGMRFQNAEVVNTEKLLNYAKRCQSPRLVQAANLWASMTDKEEGVHQL
jgi:predicted transcriptional regulator of viral defense system